VIGLARLWRARKHGRGADGPPVERIKREAGGMLSTAVYRQLYDRVSGLPDLDVVEVGGASGAGSIVIATAMRDSKKQSRLIVAEKCEGGSRSEIGSYAENVERIQENFRKFGVEDRVRLFPHELTLENADRLLALGESPRIAALVLDADGRIDRDFQLFWKRLVPGGLIVVDDYENAAKYLPISERRPTGGMKKLIVFRLFNQLRAWGLVDAIEIQGTTVFGRKPPEADFARFDPEVCREILDGVERERRERLGESA
jgi:predicted O-methyltransferase YrrM